jgi:GxxExxY protein
MFFASYNIKVIFFHLPLFSCFVKRTAMLGKIKCLTTFQAVTQHLTFPALLVLLNLKQEKEDDMSSNKEILYKELSYIIVGAAFTVHRALGCGFPEHCYHHALAIEFQRLAIPFTEQESFDVFYNSEHCGSLRTDLIIDRKIILELKSAESITSSHVAQLFSYLRATHFKVGYVLNFGSKSLEFRRIIL